MLALADCDLHLRQHVPVCFGSVLQITVSQKLHSRIVDAIRATVTAEFGVRPHIQLCPKRTIPTTTSGKVRRQQARQMFLANGLRCLAIDSAAAQEYTA